MYKPIIPQMHQLPISVKFENPVKGTWWGSNAGVR